MAYRQPELVEPFRVPGAAARPRAVREPGTAEFLVLAFVVASFAYEIPLVYVTNFYRVNPYLYDVAAFTLISYYFFAGRNRGWKVSLGNNALLAPWATVTGIFAFCTLLAVTWIPLTYYQMSVWFCLKYFEGLAVLVLFFAAPMNEQLKRRLLWVALMGGVWVASFAVLQFFGILTISRVIPKGWEATHEGTGIISTLGTAYFHAGFFGVVSTLVALALFQSSRGRARLVAGALAPFCAIPSVISGSRAAFLGLMLSAGVLGMRPGYRKQFGTYFVAAVLGAAIAYFYVNSYTYERTQRQPWEMAIEERGTNPLGQIVELVKEHGIRMFVAGGGFMTVPLNGKYRVGYGIHNMHLFPFEQGGLAAVFAINWMWLRVGLRLGRGRYGWPTNGTDEAFRSAMFAFLVAMLTVGWTGTAFWMRNGMEHFVFYELLMLGLGLSMTGGQPQPARRRQPAVYLGSQEASVPGAFARSG